MTPECLWYYYIHSEKIHKYIKYKQIYQHFYKENRTYLSNWEHFFRILSASYNDIITDHRQCLGDCVNLRQTFLIPVGSHRREVTCALSKPFLAPLLTIFSNISNKLHLCGPQPLSGHREKIWKLHSCIWQSIHYFQMCLRYGLSIKCIFLFNTDSSNSTFSGHQTGMWSPISLKGWEDDTFSQSGT